MLHSVAKKGLRLAHASLAHASGASDCPRRPRRPCRPRWPGVAERALHAGGSRGARQHNGRRGRQGQRRGCRLGQRHGCRRDHRRGCRRGQRRGCRRGHRCGSRRRRRGRARRGRGCGPGRSQREIGNLGAPAAALAAVGASCDHEGRSMPAVAVAVRAGQLVRNAVRQAALLGVVLVVSRVVAAAASWLRGCRGAGGADVPGDLVHPGLCLQHDAGDITHGRGRRWWCGRRRRRRRRRRRWHWRGRRRGWSRCGCGCGPSRPQCESGNLGAPAAALAAVGGAIDHEGPSMPTVAIAVQAGQLVLHAVRQAALHRVVLVVIRVVAAAASWVGG
mmetsp:Transcript_90753/g.256940  ORF Transcript_90753/g.256940 Transcript_90753/m.256940 type:complete len:333 (+) Transcript_90753:173-1171(+)